jgi:hypothetical protein
MPSSDDTIDNVVPFPGPTRRGDRPRGGFAPDSVPERLLVDLLTPSFPPADEDEGVRDDPETSDAPTAGAGGAGRPGGR